jgi:hypothetical protein
LVLKVVLNTYSSNHIQPLLSLNIYNTDTPDISQNFTIQPDISYSQNNNLQISDSNAPPLYIIIHIDQYGKFNISDNTELLPDSSNNYFVSTS